MDKRASPVGGISLESAWGDLGMKNVEMRVCRRNCVINFLNFYVNISMNVKFHSGRKDENINARNNSSRQPSHLAYQAGGNINWSI